jgi:hypothetical protein
MILALTVRMRKERKKYFTVLKKFFNALANVRPIPRRWANIQLLRAPDLGVGVRVHFTPVGNPTGESPDGEENSEHPGRETHGLVNDPGIEINVGVELSLVEILVGEGNLLKLFRDP